MTAPPATWAEFWRDHDVVGDAESEADAAGFAPEAARVLALGREDDLLDVGCGGGFVLAALAPTVRSVVGVDGSPRLVEAARARLAGVAGAQVHLVDAARPGDLGAAAGRRYSAILCHSVVQYLPDVAAAEALVGALLEVAAPGARILVSDLVVADSRWADARGLLRAAWRRGTLRDAWARLRRARGSAYGAVRARLGLLAVDPTRLAEVARRAGAHAEVLDAPISALANRRHLLLRR